jgi:hypothetical protein
MKACRASRGTAPLIHKLGTSWLELGDQVNALIWGYCFRYPLDGPQSQSARFGTEKVSCRSLVTIPTEPPDAVSCGAKLILCILAYIKNCPDRFLAAASLCPNGTGFFPEGEVAVT